MNDTDLIVRELHEWLSENEFTSGQILSLVNSENQFEGRCVLARRHMTAESTLTEMPVKLLFNYRQALQHHDLLAFFDWYSQLDLDQTSRLTRLDALYLLIIINRYSKSSMSSFVHSMPIKYDTPEYFDSSLVDSLPDSIRIDIQQRLDLFDKKYVFLRGLIDRYVAERGPFDVLDKNFNKESYRWAFASVNTRCFSIDENDICSRDELSLANKYFGSLSISDTLDECNSLSELDRVLESRTFTSNNQCCIVPYLDFLNHSYEDNARAHLDKERSVYVLSVKEDEEIEENKQVYIAYGYHDNKTLMIEYGFILDENIYDRVIFKLAEFESMIQSNRFVDILWQKVIQTRLYSDLSCNMAQGPSWNLLCLLDLIVHFNANQITSLTDLDDYEVYEIKYESEIRQLALKLLYKYEKDLESSISKLQKVQNAQEYHLHMCSRLVKLQLDIVKYNIEFIGNDDEWYCLF